MYSAVAGTCQAVLATQRRKALAQLGLAAAQQAGKGVLGNGIGNRGHRCQRGGGIGAQGDGDRVALAGMLYLPVAEIQRAAAM